MQRGVDLMSPIWEHVPMTMTTPCFDRFRYRRTDRRRTAVSHGFRFGAPHPLRRAARGISLALPPACDSPRPVFGSAPSPPLPSAFASLRRDRLRAAAYRAEAAQQRRLGGVTPATR